LFGDFRNADLTLLDAFYHVMDGRGGEYSGGQVLSQMVLSN
jgi:hypothetical protein